MTEIEASVERILVEVPKGTTAALEKAAAENRTTPTAIMRQYILYGIEQTLLGREFDMAMRGTPNTPGDGPTN